MAAAERAGSGARVGLVLVSHSAGLAENAAELARAMAPDVRVVPAGGVSGHADVLGTDADRVAGAIEGAWSTAGVLVLMDLGSAVLSAEFALDLIPAAHRAKVTLSAAPLVEGAVAAAVAAQTGGALEQVESEAVSGLLGKQAQLGGPPPAPAGPEPGGEGEWQEELFPVDLPLGLHARPAARVVQALAGVEAEVRASNATTGSGPVSARSLNSLATLQVVRGQRLRLEARGREAKEALSRVARLAGRAFDDPVTAEPLPEAVEPQPSGAEGVFAGLPASPGTAVGPVVRLGHSALVVPETAPGSPLQEAALLERALAATRSELGQLREQTARRAGAYEAGILDADLLFLEDPELADRTRAAVARGGVGAARAWQEAAARARAQWEGIADPRLRLRAADLEGVVRRVLAHLLGTPESTPTGSGILVAEDLNPADTAQLDPKVIWGIATAAGGPTSHSAILARSLGIPAVVGLGAPVLSLEAGAQVLLDGDRGSLVLDPSADAVEDAARERERRRRAAAAAARAASRPARTRDGVLVEVAANIGSVADARAAVAAGADGVGLLRTEFLFQELAQLPGEEEQFLAYQEIAEALAGRPLTIRTLDVGADKPLPSVPREAEANPALGVRGLRLGLAQPELLTPQLAAITRVAASHPVRVMFPMVATRDEVMVARGLLAAAPAPDHLEGVPPLQVGIMVEVPAAALGASVLAPLVDFMSIGTNDLSQYTMAADRGNAELRGLADPLHPAVLRLIALTAAAAGPGSWVGVCGELAGDPAAAELLIGLGVRELSAAPRRVAAVKEAVRAATLPRARRLAEQALELPDAGAVRELLASPRRR